MTRVKIKRTISGPGWFYQAGQVADVPDDRAASMLKLKVAEPAPHMKLTDHKGGDLIRRRQRNQGRSTPATPAEGNRNGQ